MSSHTKTTKTWLTALALLMLPGWASAADLRPAERKALEAFDHELTDHVAAVRGGMALANPGRLLQAARDRRAVLSRLVREDPEQAVAVALDRVRRKQVPAVAVGELEQEISSMGTLEVLATLPANGQKVSSIRRRAVINGQRYTVSTWGAGLGDKSAKNRSLHGVSLDGVLALAPGRLRVLKPGETTAPGKVVRDQRCPVSGKLAGANQEASDGIADAAVVVESGDTVYYLCQSEHIAQLGTQVTAAEGGSAMLLSSWTEGPKALLYIPVYFKDQASGPTLTDMNAVNAYMQANSFNKTSITTTFTPAYRLSKNAADYVDEDELYTEAQTIAAANGYDYLDYDLDCVRYDGGPGDFSGLAYVYDTGCWLKTDDAATAAHEFGHNYGLEHANSWSTTDGTTIGAGSNQDYGDIFDVMGDADSLSRSHYNAYEKNLLNWIPTGNVTSATASGTYRIYAHDLSTLNSNNRYALKVRKDADRDYWLEYRQHSGWSGQPWLMNGVPLLWDPWANSDGGSQLLDTTPGSVGGKNDAPIVIGRTFSDTQTGLHFTLTNRGGTSPDLWAEITVNIGPFTGNVAPTLALSANNSSATVNQTVTFTATANDSNGDALAYHWNFSDNTFVANSSTATKSWASTGTKTVTCIVSDMKGRTTTQTINVNIVAGITYQVSGNITSSGSPLAGVVVSDGTRSGTSDASGNYTIANVPNGSYTLTPSKFGVTFTPTTLSATVSGANVSAKNFTASLPLLLNGSFETPSVGAASFMASPSGASWTFIGANSSSGIQSNGSAWGAASAPDGVQTVFLQNLGSISQNVSLAAGTYALTFQAAQRSYGTGVQPIKISVDGAQVGNFISPTSTAFAPFTSASFTVSAGTHEIKFEGTDNTGDRSSFIDAVMISPATPPVPTITSLSPISGTTAGGTTVTISGTSLIGTTGVTFGGSAATSVAVVSATSVTCVTPAKASGAVNVVLSTPGGSVTKTSAYTYLAITANHSVPHTWLSTQNSAWTTNYEAAALADQDGDGIPTWLEYWSGTDPMSSNSSLKISSIEFIGADVVLKWQHAKVDATLPAIKIESTSDLTAGSWANAGQKVPANGLNTWSVTRSATPKTFYRLVVTPP